VIVFLILAIISILLLAGIYGLAKLIVENWWE
jgi:Flp pilus assembly pilin Flp